MGSRRQRVLDDDPLTRAIAPPPNETLHQREQRLCAEQEAKRVSDAIDEELIRQRIADKKSPKPIKILLLGQSESGKSTTLKNFQLMHSPRAFRAERAYWRTIIQLNVVQSVHAILELIARAHAAAAASPGHSHTGHPLHIVSHAGHSSHGSHGGSAPLAPSAHRDFPPLTPEHLKLKMRLAPLAQVEAVLLRRILPPLRKEEAGTGGAIGNTGTSAGMGMGHELCVNSMSVGWRGAFGFGRLLSAGGSGRESGESGDGIDWTDGDDPGVVMSACAEDMKRLWVDPVVRRMMDSEKMRPEEMAGFFLGDLDRVTSPRYIPTDDDILRARIKTLGVSEHKFTMRTGPMSHDWRVFDVGGSRSLVPAWAPYFDDMNAIIFLAPISCFDQVLQEDPSVNRLADSFLLWKTIVSHPLLKKTNLVLFLNKCDILRAKLESGIRLGDYITSYGNRPNDFESASTYLRKKFLALMKEHARDCPLYCHLTCVTDTKPTALILHNVQDVVVRDNLKRCALVG